MERGTYPPKRWKADMCLDSGKGPRDKPKEKENKEFVIRLSAGAN